MVPFPLSHPMKTPLRSCCVALSLLVAGTLPAGATCGGGGGGGSGGFGSSGNVGQVYQVPWKIFHAGQAAPPEGLVLYWFPLSRDEFQKSGLRTSPDLSRYAAG